ncbi:uncharacterized protein B0H18DRAFT_1130024 [Fomitopsis serialis]|uniref:uncharacterized protein n=1 Tax=Fomitopsis serialis TaxID=139415 RepID=UPI0020074D45|nr:uncharacterized protein B0H18DRAFT_1130024 [Neoantrodia serialis]KAH9910502.1 hypothetical protein B0H18DRAFT_1130024 [Neoantrodia serialis]
MLVARAQTCTQCNHSVWRPVNWGKEKINTPPPLRPGDLSVILPLNPYRPKFHARMSYIYVGDIGEYITVADWSSRVKARVVRVLDDNLNLSEQGLKRASETVYWITRSEARHTPASSPEMFYSDYEQFHLATFHAAQGRRRYSSPPGSWLSPGTPTLDIRSLRLGSDKINSKSYGSSDPYTSSTTGDLRNGRASSALSDKAMQEETTTNEG